MKNSFLHGSVIALLVFGAVIICSTSGVTAAGPQGKGRRAAQQKQKKAVSAQPSQDEQSTQPSVPETVASNEIVAPTTPVAAAKVKPETEVNKDNKSVPVGPSRAFTATAYTLRGRMANGNQVHRGAIAADPRVLPLGTRVYLNAGGLSGEYVVADTGGAIKGRRIDIWVPSIGTARTFGRRAVQLTVLNGRRKK